MKKYNLKKKDILNEKEIQRVFIYPTYPRGSIIYSDK